MSEQSLLPCPFCGGKPKWDESTGGAALEGAPIYRIQCSECFRIDMPWWSYRGDCISQWNTRAAIAALPGEPVAWRCRYPEGNGQWALEHNKPNSAYANWEVQPLYASPAMPVAEAGVREALADLVKSVNRRDALMVANDVTPYLIQNALDKLERSITAAKEALAAPVLPAPPPSNEALVKALADEPQFDEILLADCKRMRAAGLKLSEAAMHVIRECDGLHRLSLAVAEWTTAVANEGGRGERFTPPAALKSAMEQ